VLPVPPYEATLAAGRGSSLMPEVARARVAGHRWGSGDRRDKTRPIA
jgi:hypothetical protein